MERQEEYCQEQQQANEAETPRGAASGRKCGHEALNTQVHLRCQSEVKQGSGSTLVKSSHLLGCHSEQSEESFLDTKCRLGF